MGRVSAWAGGAQGLIEEGSLSVYKLHVRNAHNATKRGGYVGVSMAERVWYCPDTEVRVVWITYVSLAHPQPSD